MKRAFESGDIRPADRRRPIHDLHLNHRIQPLLLAQRSGRRGGGRRGPAVVGADGACLAGSNGSSGGASGEDPGLGP